jgi:hypothetical protein
MAFDSQGNLYIADSWNGRIQKFPMNRSWTSTVLGANGFKATPRILYTSLHISILVLTMFDDESVFAALRARARLPAQGRAEGQDPAGDPRRREHQSRDRRAPVAQPEDRTQPRLAYLQQAPDGRPRPGDRPRTRSQPRS